MSEECEDLSALTAGILCVGGPHRGRSGTKSRSVSPLTGGTLPCGDLGTNELFQGMGTARHSGRVASPRTVRHSHLWRARFSQCQTGDPPGLQTEQYRGREEGIRRGDEDTCPSQTNVVNKHLGISQILPATCASRNCKTLTHWKFQQPKTDYDSDGANWDQGTRNMSNCVAHGNTGAVEVVDSTIRDHRQMEAAGTEATTQ